MRSFLKKEIFLAIFLGVTILSFSYRVSSFSKDFVWPLFVTNNSSHALTNLLTFLASPETNSSVPVFSRLVIKSIKVDAPIEYVGLTKGGTMDVPKGPLSVAWFSLGSRPGDIGSAVIAGHYGWKNGVESAFDQIHLLNKGDIISVTDNQGKKISFIVRESKLYNRNAVVPEVFTSTSGSHLNLIACAGTWDKVHKTYSERIVVFSDLVP